MPRLGLLLLLVLAFLAPACGDGGTAAGDGETGPGGGGDAAGPVVELVGEDGTIVVAVEVADTSAERARGLMGRESLPAEAGMVFLYSREEEHGAYWMKDTLIPLSIAFFDAEGRIVRILDMEPCRSDPCPLYDPEAAYQGALEVNRGAFERWGIAEGDLIRLRL